jgi:hypothetical protein
VIVCPDEGQEYCGQDAQFGWDVVNDEEVRFIRDVSSEDFPIVIDNVTTLMWQGCAAGMTGASCSVDDPDVDGISEMLSTWVLAFIYCDNLGWGGYTDWRLPDPYELESIVDADSCEPAIDVTAFPATPLNWFWSSATDEWDIDYAMAMNYSYGFLMSDDKSNINLVRCVRGGLSPSAGCSRSISVVDQPTVTDMTAGLVWQGCTAGMTGNDCSDGTAGIYIWKKALSYCENLEWGGWDDWRLPDRTELQSIIGRSRSTPSFNGMVFPETPPSSFWSSSSLVGFGSAAWSVSFENGTIMYHDKASFFHVRCVR